MSEEITSKFLSKSNIESLAKALRIDVKLVQRFVAKWHVLLSYNSNKVLRKDGTSYSLTFQEVNEAVRQLNAEFIEEYSEILNRRETWEESQLKPVFYGAFGDQKPNKSVPTMGTLKPFPVWQRSNRASNYIGEVYDSQHTEYGNVIYSQQDKPKTYKQLNSSGRLSSLSVNELYARCKTR